MLHKFRYLLLLSAAAFTFTACDRTSTSAPDRRERTVEDDKSDSIALVYDEASRDPQVHEYMLNLHKSRGFNGNVLIAKKGKIIYQNTFGWANYLKRDSLKIESQFELASVSKPFTGVAIMLLVEDGKIRLDQNVKDFIPDFPYDSITVESLLTHRSGLMNYIYFTDNLWPDKRKGMSNEDAVKLIIEKKPAPYSKPNRKFHYNNTNYMLLAYIVERVTGKRFSEFMKERVFEPAGMKKSAVFSTAEYDKIPVDVIGHDRTWRYSVVQNFHDGPVGDKGVYSTVRDLYLFDRALRSGKLISQASQDSAYKSRNPFIRGHFSYGYGWRVFESKTEKVVYHTGWWHGFRHIYLRDLKNDVTIVLLTNLTNGSLHHLDGLFNLVGMPVVRKGAYSGNATTEELADE